MPIDLMNEPIVHFDKNGIPISNKSLNEIYREVQTPQTPKCEHDWRNDWGSFGPIMICTKCGEWHQD